MKAQSKSKKISSRAKGGPHKNPENVRPNVSTSKIESRQPDYTSMWQAVQKVADPVSFESLKRFYNI